MWKVLDIINIHYKMWNMILFDICKRKRWYSNWCSNKSKRREKFVRHYVGYEPFNTCSKSFSCSICQTYPRCQGLTAVRGIRFDLRINHYSVGPRFRITRLWTQKPTNKDTFSVHFHEPHVTLQQLIPWTSLFTKLQYNLPIAEFSTFSRIV